MSPLTLGMLNPHGFDLTPEIEANLKELLDKANQIQKIFGKHLIVTSGLRSDALQKQLFKAGKSTATRSKHLYGQAVDFADADRSLMRLILGNLDLMQKLELYFEDFRYTNGTGISWVHCQIVPPNSKRRIFIPSSLPPFDPNCWDGKYDKKYDGA